LTESAKETPSLSIRVGEVVGITNARHGSRQRVSIFDEVGQGRGFLGGSGQDPIRSHAGHLREITLKSTLNAEPFYAQLGYERLGLAKHAGLDGVRIRKTLLTNAR